MRPYFSIAILASSLSTPALTQSEDLATPFERCGTVEEATARLACFDGALEALQENRALLAKQNAELAQENFGLPSERTRETDSEQQRSLPEPEAVESTLQEIFTDQSRKRVFVLANGQIWRELSNSNLRGNAKAGTAAEIEKGGIGGYRLRLQGLTGFASVERVR